MELHSPIGENPLLAEWAEDDGAPPFDRIRPGDFPAAFERGMAERAEQHRIIRENTQPASFANTIEALQDSGRLLARASQMLGHFAGTLEDAAWLELEAEWSPRLAEDAARIFLEPGLFARLDALYGRQAELGLAVDQLRLLTSTWRGLVRAGARLDAAGRERMAVIEAALAELEARFSRTIQEAEAAWTLVVPEDRLQGLPEDVRASLAEAARQRGEGGYLLTLSRSTYESVLALSEDRALRLSLWEAWGQRGAEAERDNRATGQQILALREEKARLLGYPDFATYRLEETMAATPGAVCDFLGRIWQGARQRVLADQGVLAALAAEDGIERLEAWDWRFYEERQRQTQQGFDEAALKPYFSLENITAAAFDVAARLFGVGFRPADLPVWHADVRAYRVMRGERVIGLFYVDHFVRAGKRSGAWMNALQDHEAFRGRRIPIVLNCNNIPRGSPTLLGLDDARTLFHEFGHALHGLLSEARYPSQAGTNVRHDFVELPSQIMEHWLTAPGVLEAHARHHETLEAIPEGLLRLLRAAAGFGHGFAQTELSGSAMLDLALHRSPSEGLDLDGFEHALGRELGMPEAVGFRHRARHFGHIFTSGGMYAAGYYAYQWAAVLDSDGYGAFEEAGDPFDPALAQRLGVLLAAGDGCDPMALYRQFRGREPDADALLRRLGLLGAG